MNLNQTHDPGLDSWVESANLDGADFPIQNLPFAVFRLRVSDEAFRGGVAIGDQVLDLARLAETRAFDSDINELLQLCAGPSLNAFMGRGAAAACALRLALSQALRKGSERQEILQPCLVAQELVEYAVPCHIGDYTDFYSSINHATNVGKLFRPDNPLLPNYKWLPIGYHGRASSIEVTGHEITRPQGRPRRRTRTARASVPASGSTTKPRSAFISAPATRSANPSPSTTPTVTFSATAFSTTGRRAISRPGNTSRWVPSCRKVLPRRYRHGSSQARRCCPTGSNGRARRTIRNRSLTSIRSTTAAGARST